MFVRTTFLESFIIWKMKTIYKWNYKLFHRCRTNDKYNFFFEIQFEWNKNILEILCRLFWHSHLVLNEILFMSLLPSLFVPLLKRFSSPSISSIFFYIYRNSSLLLFLSNLCFAFLLIQTVRFFLIFLICAFFYLC